MAASEDLANKMSEFRRRFVVELATHPDDILAACQLRHQVYCVERKFEPAAPALLETDEFDDCAYHVVLRECVSREVLGTVRLVPATPVGPGFPMEGACGPTLLRILPRATTAEVSRFAISKERRDIGSSTASLLRLSLVQGAIRVSRSLGLTHWCAAMEPSLLRLLTSTGIHFQRLGPLVEYHGIRQPASADIANLLDRMYGEQPELWAFVINCQGYPRAEWTYAEAG